MSISDAATLREFIVEHFDLEELRTLCQDLEVDFDSLRGEGKAAKARELIAHLQRREQLFKLISLLQELRPDVSVPSDLVEVATTPPPAIQTIEDYLHKDREEAPELFRLRPIPLWVDYQAGLVPPSPAVEEVLQALEDTRLLTLLGPMGSGKSTAACHVGFRLANERGWPVLITEEPNDLSALREGARGWETLKSVDNQDGLVIVDDVHLAPKDTGEFIERVRVGFSNLRFLFVGRPPSDLPGRRHSPALELTSLPRVECQPDSTLIASLVKLRLLQLKLTATEPNGTTADKFIERSGNDLFVLTRLLRHWDGSDLPVLDTIAAHFQTDLVNLLTDETRGIDAVMAMFVVACLYEVEIESPVELLTRSFEIPWQTINTLIDRQELLETGAKLKLHHASQAHLIRGAVEQSAVLKSAITSQLSKELTTVELRLAPFLAYMLHDPSITTKICFQLTTTDGRDADWLELWRYPALEKFVTTAIEYEPNYFFMGWGLYGIGDAIYTVDPPDADYQWERLTDLANSLKPILKSRLEKASADQVVDFLMMPMIWTPLIEPLLDTLASIEVEEHAEKLRSTMDTGTIGIYLDNFFYPTGAKSGSRIVKEVFDHLLNVVESSENAEGVGWLIHTVGHVDAELAGQLLSLVQQGIKANACDVAIQRIKDEDHWDNMEALQAAVQMFDKGGAFHHLMLVMKHVVELQSDDPWLRTMYGRSFLRLKRFDQAQREFQAALALRENYVPALESLIAILLEKNRKGEAQIAFDQLRRADPERTSVAWNWLNDEKEAKR